MKPQNANPKQASKYKRGVVPMNEITLSANTIRIHHPKVTNQQAELVHAVFRTIERS
jgi:pterin-4a-carbinolamine dehydratase